MFLGFGGLQGHWDGGKVMKFWVQLLSEELLREVADKQWGKEVWATRKFRGEGVVSEREKWKKIDKETLKNNIIKKSRVK